MPPDNSIKIDHSGCLSNGIFTSGHTSDRKLYDCLCINSNAVIEVSNLACNSANVLIAISGFDTTKSPVAIQLMF